MRDVAFRLAALRARESVKAALLSEEHGDLAAAHANAAAAAHALLASMIGEEGADQALRQHHEERAGDRIVVSMYGTPQGSRMGRNLVEAMHRELDARDPERHISVIIRHGGTATDRRRHPA